MDNNKIVITNKIKSYVPCDVYVIWDVRRRHFLCRGTDIRLGMDGIWSSEDNALKSINNDEENYIPVHIDIVKSLSLNAFEFILSLYDSPIMLHDEIEQMIMSKLRQFFKVFLFNNEDMLAHFRSQHDKRLLHAK